VPVEEIGPWLPAEVRADVVGGEVEGGLVVIRRDDFRAAREGSDGGEPDAAPELDDSFACQVLAREVP
jgi:hypothetical protein